MIYQDFNIFNQLYIKPIGSRRASSLCPREELVEPRKLLAVVEGAGSTLHPWELYDRDGHVFYECMLPWNRQWEPQDLPHRMISSTAFYCVTQRPSMFRSMRDLLYSNPGPKQVEAWLLHWWNAPFALTSPIMHDTMMPNSPIGGDEAAFPYTISYRYPVQCTPLYDTPTMPDGYLTQLLNTHAYTVCNGLTLLLAMARRRLLHQHLVLHAVQQLVRRQGGSDILFQHVEDAWSALHYNHPSPHVCDYPWHYCQMGCDNLLDVRIAHALREEPANENDQEPEVAPITLIGGGNGVFANLTTMITSSGSTKMLCHWPNTVESVFPGANADAPADSDDDDEGQTSVFPDIPSLVLAVTRTKRTWRTWVRHKERFLASTIPMCADAEACLEAWLVPLCHFYVCAKEHTPHLCNRRLRAMWLDALAHIDPEKRHLPSILHRWMLKRIILDELHSQGRYVLTPVLKTPFIFLKDIWHMYGPSLRLQIVKMHRVYSNVSHAMLHVFPDAKPTTDRCIKISRSLVQLWKLAKPESPYGKFWKHFLEPQIAQRLLCIQNGFGIKQNQDATLFHHHASLHTVGTVFMEYLRQHNNRECLWF